METNEEYFDSLPANVREIYRGVFLLGAAEKIPPEKLKKVNPDCEDVPSYLRSILNPLIDSYIYGGQSMNSEDLARVQRLHDLIWEKGNRGLALLLSHVLAVITRCRGDLREHAYDFHRAHLTDFSRIREEEDLSSNSWLRNVLRAIGVNPDLVRMLGMLDQAEAEMMREESETGVGEPAETSQDPQGAPETEIQQAILSDPTIPFLRSVFRRYTDMADNHAMGMPDAREAMEDLAAVDPEYLKSPFLPITIEPNTWGGKIISLVFVSRPDRIYTAWVYGRDPEDFRLRGFSEAGASDEQVKKVLRDPGVVAMLEEASRSRSEEAGLGDGPGPALREGRPQG